MMTLVNRLAREVPLGTDVSGSIEAALGSYAFANGNEANPNDCAVLSQKINCNRVAPNLTVPEVNLCLAACEFVHNRTQDAHEKRQMWNAVATLREHGSAA